MFLGRDLIGLTTPEEAERRRSLRSRHTVTHTSCEDYAREMSE